MSNVPSRFRTSFTMKEGFTAAMVVQCRVVNVNVVNYTVDVTSAFDRKRYFNIQLSSNYLHFNNGEGVSVTPEVGAVCMVCIPSDSSPPFVLAFIMPHTLVDGSTDDAPSGTATQQGTTPKYATDASFAGGRPQAKPGDMVFRTRDNNFLMLHRGGVLQLGATELAQRIYIPLNNLITDISGNYAHHNTGGSVLWGFQEGPATENFPCLYTHNFRIRANDAEADVRVRVGEVRVPMPEPPGNDGDQSDLTTLKIGDDQKNNPIICEITVAPKGFVTGTGDPAKTTTFKETILRFFFDRKGGTFLRCKGSLLISSKDNLKIKATNDITIEGKTVSISVPNGASLDGGQSTHIKGDLIRFGAGAAPNARQGDIVTSVFPPSVIPIIGVVGGTGPGSGLPVTGFILGGQITGTITSGNPAVLS